MREKEKKNAIEKIDNKKKQSLFQLIKVLVVEENVEENNYRPVNFTGKHNLHR